ncbi:MAG: hypothetical protein J6A89_08245 [Clostridia bacterium]|nr:hypothetical protein [Clostridia bacterium]
MFKNVYVVPCKESFESNTTMNNMVIATDDILILENAYDLNIEQDEIVLTDDYCPVESLIPQR